MREWIIETLFDFTIEQIWNRVNILFYFRSQSASGYWNILRVSFREMKNFYFFVDNFSPRVLIISGKNSWCTNFEFVETYRIFFRKNIDSQLPEFLASRVCGKIVFGKALSGTRSIFAFISKQIGILWKEFNWKWWGK